MGMDATLAVIALALAVFVAAVVAERRPYRPGRIWRPPWRLLMALSLTLVMAMAAHLVGLLSGQPVGRLPL